MLDVRELAAYLGTPVSTFYGWRTRGLGLRAYRFGKHLKFAVSDVRTWIEQRRDPSLLPLQRGGDLMSRKRVTIGTFGEIGYLVSPSGRVVGCAGHRDWDGKTRLVQATGATGKSVERVMKAKLADRSFFQPSFSALAPDSPIPDLVAYWLEDLELEDWLSKRTLQLHERNMPPRRLHQCSISNGRN